MTAAAPRDDLVEVTLVGVPLAAYQAASEHGDELRREFALMAAGDAVESVPARLVALMEALQTRYSTFGESARIARDAALARGDDHMDLVYRVPPALKEGARQLDELLDEADEFCRRGDHLLTLAAPAEALTVRRWFLSQFVDQIDGAPPTPWEDWVVAQSPPAAG